MDRVVSRRKPSLSILIAGVSSSVVCLALIFLLNKTGFELMQFYLWYIVPAGAIVVGLASGSGYAIGSKLANVRVSKAFLGAVFVLALATYVGAQYLTYLQVLKANDISRSQVSFVRYVQLTSENMTYKEMEADAKETELGKLGYGLQALAAVGFAFGAVIPVLTLRQFSYCPACQMYMTSAGSFYAGSTAQVADLKKRKKQEKKDAIAAAIVEVSALKDKVMEYLATAPLDETISALSQLTRAAPSKAIAYIQYDLHRCPRCDAHHIKVTLNNQTVDGKRNTSILVALPKAASEIAQVGGGV
ncbi:MAG: hypothetical protein JW889_14085 [Verrucomicrobia bacterium]|nr:hypothetical protein [Verrucomicrobiota bacterium]